jgi:translation initiation factor RLI1
MGKKKDKVVDLKPQKITDEQLGEVQKIVNAMNRAQMELGMLETRKHNMLHDIAAVQDKLAKMQGEFEKEYGTFDINIQDGTINYKDDEPSNS